MRFLVLMLVLCLITPGISGELPAVIHLLKQYQSQTKIKFNVLLGEKLWQKKYISSSKDSIRSCTSCHTKNLTVKGEHIKTKKVIAALAPSVNSKRLTKIKTIKKWFKRNCKWTLGRECTATEKGHLLTYIQSQ